MDIALIRAVLAEAAEAQSLTWMHVVLIGLVLAFSAALIWLITKN